MTIDFAALPLVGEAPMTVGFVDMCDPTPASWLWDFGDGNTSTVQNPIHTYETQGHFDVTLTATF